MINLNNEYNKLSPNNISIQNNEYTFKKDGEYAKEIDSANHVFNIKDNVKVKLFLFSKKNKLNINNVYNLGKNSSLKLYIFNENEETNLEDKINLDGETSEIQANYLTVSRNRENYHIIVNHNHDNIISNIYFKGVSLNKSNVMVKIDSNIEKGNKNNVMNQTSRIITVSKDAHATIIPNMYTHDNTVEAKHGSVVGYINEDNLFYLTSRGIDEYNAKLLIIKSLLFEKVEMDMYIRSVIMESILNLSEDDLNE